MIRVAVVIPAYNEAGTIRDIAQRALRQSTRLIIVDDGSTDRTAEALSGLPLTLVRNPENSGKGASLWRGIERAVEEGADAVVTLDGDGQHLPEDIPRLVDAYTRHRNAIVVGSRLHDRHRMPLDRYLANRAANFFIGWAAGLAMTDSQSGFRVYPAALLRSLKLRRNRAAGFVFESEVLIEAVRSGTELVDVPVAAIYEQRGRRSHFRPVLDIARITRMVAWKLLARGLDLPGLVRSLRGPQPRSRDG